jgi:hypothetical protein
VFHDSTDVFPACLRYKLRLVIDPAALQIVLGVLTGWLDRREREAVAYLIEENRVLSHDSAELVAPFLAAVWRPNLRPAFV